MSMRVHVAGTGGQADVTNACEIDTDVEVTGGVGVRVCAVAEGGLLSDDVELGGKGLSGRVIAGSRLLIVDGMSVLALVGG